MLDTIFQIKSGVLLPQKQKFQEKKILEELVGLNIYLYLFK